ncbi:MAG: WG repeat-containing protein [Bdellovibrionales bacterium]|nr:WG repeat-containing protein [Bdellovibrionales bacterium]
MAAKNFDGEYGFFSFETGVEVIPFQFAHVLGGFREGVCLVRVQRNGKWKTEMINKNGSTLFTFPVHHEPSNSASDGMIRFKDRNTKLFGFYNLSGEVVLEAKYEFARPFKKGFASVRLPTIEHGKSKWVVIDKVGHVVLGFSEPVILNYYHNGATSVTFGCEPVEGKDSTICLSGCVDNQGKLLSEICGRGSDSELQ